MRTFQKAALLLSCLYAVGWCSNALAGGHWNTFAAEPTALAFSASGQINGIVYVAGGNDASTNLYDTLQAFNPVTNTWASLASMPQALTQEVGGVINSQLYVAGGDNVADSNSPISTLYVYDPPSNTWSQKADMPQPCAGGAGGVIDSKFYVTCPYAGNGTTGSPTFDVYDPASDSWTALANVPVPAGAAGAVINGQFYMANGNSGLGTTEVYNSANNTWTQLKSMLTWENEVSGVELDGRLYVFGGEPASCPVTTVQAYDPVLNKWKKVSSPMPVASAGESVQVVYGIAFVIGGGNCSGNSGANQAFLTIPSIP